MNLAMLRCHVRRVAGLRRDVAKCDLLALEIAGLGHETWCFFPSEIAVADDERYPVCAADAAAVVLMYFFVH